MKNIKRINLGTGTVDTISIFDSELTRWFDERGLSVEDNFVEINALVPPCKDADLISAQVGVDLQHYAAAGFEYNGKKYVFFDVAASGSRKATSMWVEESVYPELFRWCMCGLKKEDVNEKIAVNKFLAYIGLLASASKRFEDVFGTRIDPRRIGVIKDDEINVSGVMDLVSPSGVDHDAFRRCTINTFDGFAIVNAELTNGESFTGRAPWDKFFAQAVYWNNLKRFGLRNGKSSFVDYWGNTRSLDDVDLVLTESCFKAAKLYSSFEQYCKAFEELGHSICVCIREHSPKLKGMPYQQGQTLLGDEQDADEFAAYAAGTLLKYESSVEAANLLPKGQKQVATMYPALLHEAHTARNAQAKYTSKRNEVLGGRMPEKGYVAFIAPDVVAFAQHLFGLPIVGSLKAGECACSNCTKGYVDITRNPHFDNAHCVLNNVGTMGLIPKKSPTLFVNIFDLTTVQLRADYDGDHVFYSQDSALLKLVAKTIAAIGPSAVDWDVEKAKKSRITRSELASFVSKLLKGSEIGIYADALTKMWAHGYNRDVCDWLTWAGNVLIDAAKHAAVKVDKPDSVKMLDYMPLPSFCRYAKADAQHPAESKYWDETVSKTIWVDGKKTIVTHPRTAYTGSFLDMYSKKVGEMTPAHLQVKDIDDMAFDPEMLLVNPKRPNGRLAGLSRKARKYNEDTGTYEDGGIFQQIAFRHAAEWKKLVKTVDEENINLTHIEWEKAKVAEAKREMLEWAHAQYPDVEVDDETLWTAIYDIVTRNVFSVINSTVAYDDCIKRTYWAVFGEKAAMVVADKLEADGEVVLASFNEDEEDFD